MLANSISLAEYEAQVSMITGLTPLQAGELKAVVRPPEKKKAPATQLSELREKAPEASGVVEEAQRAKAPVLRGASAPRKKSSFR